METEGWASLTYAKRRRVSVRVCLCVFICVSVFHTLTYWILANRNRKLSHYTFGNCQETVVPSNYLQFSNLLISVTVNIFYVCVCRLFIQMFVWVQLTFFYHNQKILNIFCFIQTLLICFYIFWPMYSMSSFVCNYVYTDNLITYRWLNTHQPVIFFIVEQGLES